MGDVKNFDQIFDDATVKELDFDSIFCEDDELIDIVLCCDESALYDQINALEEAAFAEIEEGEDLIGEVPGQETKTDKDESHDDPEGTKGNDETGAPGFNDGTGNGTQGAKSDMETEHECGIMPDNQDKLKFDDKAPNNAEGTDAADLGAKDSLEDKEENCSEYCGVYEDLDDTLAPEAKDLEGEVDIPEEKCCSEDLDDILATEGDDESTKGEEALDDLADDEDPVKESNDLDDVFAEEADEAEEIEADDDDDDLDDVLGEEVVPASANWFANLHEGEGSLVDDIANQIAQDEEDIETVNADDPDVSLDYDADEDEDLINKIMDGEI